MEFKCTYCGSVRLEYGELRSNTVEVYFSANDRALLDALSGKGKGSVSSWLCLDCSTIGLYSENYRGLNEDSSLSQPPSE